MINDPFFDKYNQNSSYTVKNKGDNDWIEESFGKYSWVKKSQGDSSFIGKTISNYKFIIIQFLIILIIIVLGGKSFYIQIAQGEKYSAMAESNRIRIVPILAERGNIYDRNQKRLVYNFPDFYLAITPNDLPKDGEERFLLIENIASIIDLPAKDIEERLSQFSRYNYQSVPIKTNLIYDQALELEILNNTYPALQVKNGIRREYEIPESMSHILGFLRKVSKRDLENNPEYLPTDDIGKSGIESSYEEVLRGNYGKKQIEVDALGRHIATLAKEDPSPGDDIVLTIDSVLQKKVEDIFRKHLSAHGISRGSVIISDPNNGEILAMVSEPSFDNNLFSGGLSIEDYAELVEDPDKPMFNRSISGEYPSGSTIKMVFAAAALQEGLIEKDTSFLSTGGIEIGEWFFPDWKFGGHGYTNVRKALAESVNTFFYIIGGGKLNKERDDFILEGLGVKRLVEYAQKFGLGSKLKIDIPGERDGFLPSKEWKEEAKGEPWYIGDTYHIAIGQGDILVTPLQVNAYTAVFANKGTLYKPHFVKTITHGDSSLTVTEPEILNKDFISDENMETVRAGLRDGVTYGSSRSMSTLNFTVAGKTGTAQWRTGKKPHAWWTGFAPYEDPEIAITVLVEEGGEGSRVAIPIAKEIMWWFFNT